MSDEALFITDRGKPGKRGFGWIDFDGEGTPPSNHVGPDQEVWRNGDWRIRLVDGQIFLKVAGVVIDTGISAYKSTYQRAIDLGLFEGTEEEYIQASDANRIQTGQDRAAVAADRATVVTKAGEVAANKTATDANAASALTSKNAAELSAGAASAAAGGVIYPDTTAGLTATAANGFFIVQGDGTSSYALLYQKVSGAAVLRATYPSKAALDSLSSVLTVGRPATPVTSATTASSGTYVLDASFPRGGILKSFRAWALAPGTIYLKRFTKSGDDFTQVGADFAVAVSAGLNTITAGLSGFPPLTGEYLGFFTATGVLAYTTTATDGQGYFFAGGNLTSFTDASSQTTPRLEFACGFELGAVPENTARIAELSGAVSGYKEIVPVGRPGAPSAGSLAPDRVFVYANPLTKSGLMKTVRIAPFAAGPVKFKRFKLVGATLVQVGLDYTVTVVLGQPPITLIDVVPAQAGEYVGIYAPGVLAYNSGSGDSGGYFYNGAGNTSSFDIVAPVTGTRLEIGFDFDVGIVAQMRADLASLSSGTGSTGGASAGDTIGDMVASAAIAMSGLAITTGVKLMRDGALIELTDIRTLPAATGSTIRYDVLWLDPETQSFSLASGTERANDPTAFIPALSSPKAMPLYRLRVTATAVTPVPVWTLDAYGDVASAVSAIGAARRRSRRCLPGTLARIGRGLPFRLLGFGDSISAVQCNPPGFVAPNGQYRDRASAPLTEVQHYLRDRYGADVADAIPLYTAAQLGRADDGAGQVHTRIGWNWGLVAALEARGYTLGTDLWYDNFATGSQHSGNAVSGGVPTAWLTAAAGLGAHLAIVGFGMNERPLGTTDTEANLLVIAETFRAAGTEVVFVDCPRPRVGSLSDWRRVNRTIANAARKASAAHLSLVPLYEDRYIQNIGIATADVCAANGNNHPGMEELSAIGRELVKLVVDDL